MQITRGGRHLYQSSTYERVTKVVKIRRKGKSPYGDPIWELKLLDGTDVRTSATCKHPFKSSGDFPKGIPMRLTFSKARGTVTEASWYREGR